jgi:hypothetical protein
LSQYEQQRRSEDRNENPGNIVISIICSPVLEQNPALEMKALLSVALAMGEEVQEGSKDVLEETLEKLSQGKVPK